MCCLIRTARQFGSSAVVAVVLLPIFGGWRDFDANKIPYEVSYTFNTCYVLRTKPAERIAGTRLLLLLLRRLLRRRLVRKQLLLQLKRMLLFELWLLLLHANHP